MEGKRICDDPEYIKLRDERLKHILEKVVFQKGTKFLKFMVFFPPYGFIEETVNFSDLPEGSVKFSEDSPMRINELEMQIKDTQNKISKMRHFLAGQHLNEKLK